MVGESWILMRIGRGKRSKFVGNYHREHRKLGVVGSETEAEQVSRFEEFLIKSERAVMLGNVAVIGDFNINLDPDFTDLSTVMLKLKDRLLDMYPLTGLVQVVENCTRHCFS